MTTLSFPRRAVENEQPKTITMLIVVIALLLAFVIGPLAYAIWGPHPEYERHGQERSTIR